MTSLRFRARSFVRWVRHSRLHTREIKSSYHLLGSEYGAWPLLRDHTPERPVIFSFGVGQDLSFDLAAIDRFDAQVHAFDPTPKSMAWIETQELPDALKFHPCGVAATDGAATFFPPANDQNVSFSAQPASAVEAAGAVSSPVKRLSTFVAEYGTPDIVKMDIEGFEYEVLGDLLSTDLRPSQLLIEFHHGMYDIDDEATLEAIRKLQASGYLIFYVSDVGQEYGLVCRSVI